LHIFQFFFRDDKCLFPADPLLLDYAERILSALPQLFLQNDDRTSYSIAATGILACSLRRHGVYPKSSKFQQKEMLEASKRENDMHEKLWRSFFENLSPLNSFSVDSALLTGSSSSSAKLFEFEDIPASNEHILSNSDDAYTISDVCRSPKNLIYNNMSGQCQFFCETSLFKIFIFLLSRIYSYESNRLIASQGLLILTVKPFY
uniref:Cyclin_C domain-containing protein n=1 Tax=Onchocerca flexuosa TaxID=387005 RepID=A0A183HX87_9BILA